MNSSGHRPIFVIGFMAAGKSTVGKRMAGALGRRFVDLDELVEEQSGKRIAEIFASEGEPAFRSYEANALSNVLEEHDTNLVVACGGGTPFFRGNLARMKKNGLVVSVRASFDEVMARVGGSKTRPLLQKGGVDAARKLFAERQAGYDEADIVVDTDHRDIDSVAQELGARVARRLGDVHVRLAERSYPIHLTKLDEVGPLVHELIGARTVAIVTDDNVTQAGHAAVVEKSLSASGIHSVMVSLPSGEQHKVLDQVARVAQACIDGGLDRHGAIVAVGGGVVGDLAGFVAASLFRGVAVAQVPTTLLAMVDSAIGGKTGVNLPSGKNLLGAFWQPRFVLADVHTLDTLPEREQRAAFGEILKYALLGDEPLLQDLERDGIGVPLAEVILRCARHKADVVAADERESGRRAVLNLGHTVGHAMETDSDGALRHGEAVALGLIATVRVSAHLELCSPALVTRVRNIVAHLGLDSDLDARLTDKMFAIMGVDKKRTHGGGAQIGPQIGFVALKSIGEPTRVGLAPSEIAQILKSTVGKW